jgi:hypothetical protein
MVARIVDAYKKMNNVMEGTNANTTDSSMSVSVLLNSIREMVQTRKLVGVVVTASSYEDDPFLSEWGPNVSDSGFEIYARIYPSDTKSISISNVWNGCLIAFKARTSEEEDYSYSLMILVPWNITSSSEFSEAMCEERIRRGLDPACSLKSNIVPVYGISEVNYEDSGDIKRPSLFRLSPGHNIHNIKVGDGFKIITDGGKKSRKSQLVNDSDTNTMQIASVGGYEWLFAAAGKKTDELDALIERRFKTGSVLVQKGKNVHIALHEHLSNLCDGAAMELFGGDDHIPFNSLKSACRAVRLMINAHTSFLRTIPMLRPCLPYSLTETLQVPLLLAICVHIALNPGLFSLNMNATMHNCSELHKELQTRVGVINASNELPLDAIISTIIKSTQCEHAMSLPAMESSSRTVNATAGLYSFEISSNIRTNLTECAAIGFNIVNTFYGARCRVDKKSHDVRNYFNGLTPVHDNMNVKCNSSAFDNAHAFCAESMKDAKLAKPPPIPPWPLSLIPESKFHRMIVLDLLEPLNHFARRLLNSSFDGWIKLMMEENGFSMFAEILRRGWENLELTDCNAVVISDRLYSTCVKCNEEIHSCEYAIPFAKAHCRVCRVRMCYNCIKSAGPIASMGFLCSACTDDLVDLGDSSDSSDVDDNEDATQKDR